MSAPHLFKINSAHLSISRFQLIFKSNYLCLINFTCSTVIARWAPLQSTFCTVSCLLICEIYFLKTFQSYNIIGLPSTGTKLQVHYDLRCNRLVCEGVELLGLTLSPVSECKPMVWRELNMLPFNDKTLTVCSLWPQ